MAVEEERFGVCGGGGVVVLKHGGYVCEDLRSWTCEAAVGGFLYGTAPTSGWLDSRWVSLLSDGFRGPYVSLLEVPHLWSNPNTSMPLAASEGNKSLYVLPCVWRTGQLRRGLWEFRGDGQ